MAQTKAPPKPGFVEKLTKQYIQQPHKSYITDEEADAFHILSEQERAVIKKVSTETYLASAMLGVLGVLVLYLPQYYFPQLFPDSAVTLFSKTIQFPVVATVYGIVLVFAEIYALNFYNARAVRKIAAVCRFPSPHTDDYEFHLQSLTNTALEKEESSIKNYGINPYYGIPKFLFFAYFLINKLKATLSNLVVKIIIKRLLGRVAIRQITDMAGIPIFAFWNYWASRQVIKEAIIRIMAPGVIKEQAEELYREFAGNENFKAIIMDALQYAAILKRNYNFAHYLLAQELTVVFELQNAAPQNNFYAQLAALDDAGKKGVEKLLSLAVIIDGRLSWWEKNRLEKLIQQHAVAIDMEELKEKTRQYVNGKGLKL